jgi:hypothetical protein
VVVAVRLFFFCDRRSREVSSGVGEALARRLVRGPGVIGRTGSINSARLSRLTVGADCVVCESSGASVAGELSIGDSLGLASGEAARVGDGDVVGDGDSVETEGGDTVGLTDFKGLGVGFFFLEGFDFLGDGVGVGGGPVKNLLTFWPNDSLSDVPRAWPAIATVIIAIRIVSRLSLTTTDLIFC